MRFQTSIALGAALALTAACTNSRIEGRARAEPSSKIETLALVFDDSGRFASADKPNAYRDTYTNVARGNENSKRMAILIRERFPAVFAADGIDLQVYNLSSGEERWQQEAAGRRHVLYMKPYAESFSTGTRMNTFTMRAELHEVQPVQRVLWSGFTSVSYHDFASLDSKTVDGFAAKIVQELKAGGLIGAGARTVAVPASPPPSSSLAAPGFTPLANVTPVGNVNAVPLLNDRGRQGYREWLTKSPPRAFVIAEDGSWYSTWGRNPKEASDPQDPAERALARCERRGRPNCRLYAVDDRVVWKR